MKLKFPSISMLVLVAAVVLSAVSCDKETPRLNQNSPFYTPDAVDLGLPSGIKWASFNLGASAPEEYGDYYAWGATEPWYNGDSQTPSSWKKSDGYTWVNCPFNGRNGLYSSLFWYVHKSECVDANGVLLPANDAAHVNLGGNWRMPTKDEFEELIDNCSWTWTTLHGHYGYKVQSMKFGYTDNWIFLPVAGRRIGTERNNVRECGYYWSSFDAWALFLYFKGDVFSEVDSRCFGLSVRPVYPKGEGEEDGKEERVSEVSLNKITLSLTVGSSDILVATVTPSTASNKEVNWSSSNPSVATVDSNGMVTGKTNGTAIITVETLDGNKTANCVVSVINTATADAIDLGLPSGIKWASFNLGASAPEEYGGYYAWGAIEPWYSGDSQSPSLWKKSDGYTWANCPFNGGSNEFDEAYWNAHKSECVDANDVLLPSNDAAHVNLGGNWRIPTEEEWDELANIENCSWIWTKLNGHYGYKVQSMNFGYTDNWIFLPAAGNGNHMYLGNMGDYGEYWSSSILTDYPRDAWCLGFISDYLSTGGCCRYYGLSVRPVTE